MDLGDVTFDTFAGREGEVFGIQFADARLELELAEVSRMPEDWGHADRPDPFSLVFHGPADHVLPQHVWPLDHDELGRLEVFLVPLGPQGPDGGPMLYEAVFT